VLYIPDYNNVIENFEVCGMPDGLTFQKPGKYRINELKALMKANLAMV
jgi:hypothetical protein